MAAAHTISILVMGVAGAGKTALGSVLAAHRGLPFLDADDLHSTEAVAKMRAGIPLDDGDRAPWLDRVAERLERWRSTGQGGVVACSALRRAYRDRLRCAAPDLLLIYPDIPADVLRDRLSARAGHFMPAGLLDSQLAALEPPGEDEDVLRLEARSVEAMVHRASEWVDARERGVSSEPRMAID